MTKIDFRPILTDDEYQTFGNLLYLYLYPTGAKTVRYKCKTNKHNEMILSVNTYDKDEILKIANEKLKSPRATITRKEALNKVIKHIEEKA